jgi:type I restriction enzyme M protein
MPKAARDHAELVERVLRGAPTSGRTLRFFKPAELARLELRLAADDRVELLCLKRGAWRRARPEELVRQAFLAWIHHSLGYPLERIQIDWPIRTGSDADSERADIAVFNDDACTDPHILFALTPQTGKAGLEQLRGHLRATGCQFGCWSDGNDHSFQLREDPSTRKGPPRFRDIARLPRRDQDPGDILQPLTFAELAPIADMRALIERLEHDALANAGVNAFDELFKLLFAKLHDELRPRREPRDPVEFRVPAGSPDAIYRRFNDLFLAATRRPHWDHIFDAGDVLRLRGDALRLCAAALEPYSLLDTDLEAIDAAFEHLVNPEQKGQKGQYFTPRPVIKMAVRMLQPAAGERVIDPACGSCGFLIHTIRFIQRRHGRSRRVSDDLYAVDFDERLKKVAKTMMIIAGDGQANVFGVNALDVREWQNSAARTRIGEFSRDARDGDFDLVLTNPPFAGKITGKTQLSAFDLHELAATGELADDDDDAEPDRPRPRRKVLGMKRDVLFVERCLDLLKPGGRAAIVLPQGNLNNLGTRALRAYVASRARVLAVVGLHVNTFKPFTGTKTSALFLQKWGAAAGPPRPDYPIFMATSQRSGKTSSGDYIYRTDASGDLVVEDGRPVIDHDLDDIAAAFVQWARTQGLSFVTGD